ncbi:uncharacterized protein SOCE836_042340 [Sorangium cellulosum]|uniref:Uncharacterized protein n=1 Tax=Sorangium cellulosum TaxID=56 RepID=A0A4P2QQ55_SORCE|nr:uncharacterized protein SOCE836_042340 [Sorangium cellulosum]WCQ91469.1 hypothetical protein NQZ70_04190 [Sorangium sp. Soce836]
MGGTQRRVARIDAEAPGDERRRGEEPRAGQAGKAGLPARPLRDTDVVDEACQQSFPASDPPAWTPAIAGLPRNQLVAELGSGAELGPVVRRMPRSRRGSAPRKLRGTHHG